MGAAVTSNEDIYQKLKFMQNSLGGIPSPFDCFLAHRGLKTLHLSRSLLCFTCSFVTTVGHCTKEGKEWSNIKRMPWQSPSF